MPISTKTSTLEKPFAVSFGLGARLGIS